MVLSGPSAPSWRRTASSPALPRRGPDLLSSKSFLIREDYWDCCPCHPCQHRENSCASRVSRSFALSSPATSAAQRRFYLNTRDHLTRTSARTYGLTFVAWNFAAHSISTTPSTAAAFVALLSLPPRLLEIYIAWSPKPLLIPPPSLSPDA